MTIKSMRLGNRQKLILKFIEREGGEHVFIGVSQTRANDLLGGHDFEDIQRSLELLVKREFVIKKNQNFYALPNEPERKNMPDFCNSHKYESLPGTKRQWAVKNPNGTKIIRYDTYQQYKCTKCGYTTFRPLPKC